MYTVGSGEVGFVETFPTFSVIMLMDEWHLQNCSPEVGFAFFKGHFPSPTCEE